MDMRLVEETKRQSALLSVTCVCGVVVSASYALWVLMQRVSLESIRNSRKKQERLMDLVGNTPLLLIQSVSNETGCKIYGKCEFLNPCGSSKDRICKAILNDALNRGFITKGGTMIEASSGSTGISLTRLARSVGLNSLIILPSDIAEEKQQLIRTLGGQIELVLPSSIVNPTHFVNVAQKRAKEIPNSMFMNQFENDLNLECHYLTTGPEVWSQCSNLDVFVTSAGTCGTLGGVSKFLKSRNPSILSVLADCQVSF